MLEKLFHLKENGTTVKTELIAGVTTFITMVYILASHLLLHVSAWLRSQTHHLHYLLV